MLVQRPSLAHDHPLSSIRNDIHHKQVHMKFVLTHYSRHHNLEIREKKISIKSVVVHKQSR